METRSIVVLSLQTPKERLWGELIDVSSAGVTLRGIDLSSFDDFVSQVLHPEGDRIGLPTLFFPMLRVERIALDDEYFITRKLYPNVDFYSGIIYQAMGFRPEMFTVLFALPRMAGWLAQWQEMLRDGEQKIARPRQVYIGQEVRNVREAEGHDLAAPPYSRMELEQAAAG